MGLILIGDLHGNTQRHLEIINKFPSQETIQLGDYGFSKQHSFFLNNVDTNKHKVLFGNHDDYNFINEKHSLGNYGCRYVTTKDNEVKKLFWYRGAWSIDRKFRTKDIDWWEEEEIKDESLIKEIKLFYLKERPDIVISHDCPRIIYPQLFNIFGDTSITSLVLYQLYELHQPKEWYFGHHHKNKQMMYENTLFRCINTDDYLEL
jgi:hypothetical protein